MKMFDLVIGKYFKNKIHLGKYFFPNILPFPDIFITISTRLTKLKYVA